MTGYLLERFIVTRLVKDLVAGGLVIDVNDNGEERGTHILEASTDAAAIIAAVFSEDHTGDLCVDCADSSGHTLGHFRLIRGNGISVISDYSTNLEHWGRTANALADYLDNDTHADEAIAAFFKLHEAMAAKLQELVDAWPQLDGDDEVNGGDMVEFVGGYREGVKTLLEQRRL